jgi:hypothetical protein
MHPVAGPLPPGRSPQAGDRYRPTTLEDVDFHAISLSLEPHVEARIPDGDVLELEMV